MKEPGLPVLPIVHPRADLMTVLMRDESESSENTFYNEGTKYLRVPCDSDNDNLYAYRTDYSLADFSDPDFDIDDKYGDVLGMIYDETDPVSGIVIF